MNESLRKTPRCSQCGECCRTPVVLITKPSDYDRWVLQEREDILKHATKPPVKGYGDFWMDMKSSEQSSHCPFIKKAGEDTYTCIIQDTKPVVCRKFYCEWAYGAGKKGIPFKTERGWTDKAKKLGYGRSLENETDEETG